ncbi:ras association domain-containing protein 9 [Scleropages formosus]|uniref:ras association domain-containing protein 9 n=1 Tax=Scleropages formosus TaxID=113540 RepID=UPI0010FA907B|nr:ras association domain-containing protein 9 [Scleropages formosus]
MTPFGRNFLKARLKSRSEGKDSPGKEIQVWLCHEEKVICGLTKRTTCSDVVQALLDDHRNIPEHDRVLHGEARDYCLLERWRGFERALPPLTRILRLWEAWGEEKPVVQFVMVRVSECPPHSNKKASRYSSLRIWSKPWQQEPTEYVQSLPVNQQKRIVKKAFRKLDKIRKQKTSSRADGIDEMVQLIIAQDHMIHQQIHHMRELDLQIERTEQNLQRGLELKRLDWGDLSLLDEAQDPCNQQEMTEQQEYLYTSNGINQLEVQLKKHWELIGKLSSDIDTELLRLLSGTEEPQGATAAISAEPGDPQDSDQLEGIRRDLEQSMHRDVFSWAQMDLERSEFCCNRGEFKRLVAMLSSLHVGGIEESIRVEDSRSEPRCGSMLGKLSLNSSPWDVTDTDSDTGISSTHSQDSLSPCKKRPPALDTNV